MTALARDEHRGSRDPAGRSPGSRGIQGMGQTAKSVVKGQERVPDTAPHQAGC